jgi:hypothetical protein
MVYDMYNATSRVKAYRYTPRAAVRDGSIQGIQNLGFMDKKLVSRDY